MTTIAQEHENLIYSNGLTIDADTGEVLNAQYLINNDAKLFSYLRHLKGFESRYNEIKAMAETLLQRLEREKESYRSWFEPQAADYVKARLAATKADSSRYTTLEGGAQLRHIEEGPRIVNKKDALAHAKAANFAIVERVSVALVESEYKRCAAEKYAVEGTLPPGVRIECEHDALSYFPPKVNGAVEP
jgi:hypothetical protein